jgi:hypothetical protein
MLKKNERTKDEQPCYLSATALRMSQCAFWCFGVDHLPEMGTRVLAGSCFRRGQNIGASLDEFQIAPFSAMTQ